MDSSWFLNSQESSCEAVRMTINNEQKDNDRESKCWTFLKMDAFVDCWQPYITFSEDTPRPVNMLMMHCWYGPPFLVHNNRRLIIMHLHLSCCLIGLICTWCTWGMPCRMQSNCHFVDYAYGTFPTHSMILTRFLLVLRLCNHKLPEDTSGNSISDWAQEDSQKSLNSYPFSSHADWALGHRCLNTLWQEFPS